MISSCADEATQKHCERGGMSMKGTMKWFAATLVLVPAMLAVYAMPSEPPAGATQEAVKGQKAEAKEGRTASSQYTLTVLNPQGPVKKGRDLAPRLGTLKGKKVAMWLSATPDQLYAGKGEELFVLLEKMLAEKYPGIKIVSHTDLPMKFAPEDEVVAAITATHPDAVVAGFGG
jgi:hypothetical protein